MSLLAQHVRGVVVVRAILLALAASPAPPCLADTFILTNGDRVTGQIQRIEPGKVVVATDYAGEVKIDWARIADFTADKPMTLELDNGSRLYGDVSGDSSTIRIRSLDGSLTNFVEVKRVDAIFPEVLQDRLVLSGRINIGASETSGNTQTGAAHLDAELVARKGQDRYTAGTLFNRTTNEGVKTASNARLYASYDRFFTKKWYATADTTLEHDPFADIELRATAGVGIGYQALASARTNLALESGVSYVYTNHYQQPTETYPALRLALRFDYYLIPDRLQFFNASELYIGNGESQPSFARTQTGLRVPLWENFLATLQYNVNWNSHPPPGFVTTDRMLLLALGYHW
jgi:putative salt-induced outer membrane protein YdiY